MAAVKDTPIEPPPAFSAESDTGFAAYRRFWFLIGAGWLFTNLGYNVSDMPLRFLLKDELRLSAEAVSFFFFLSQFSNYIKPIAGILTDAIPFLGTRRRHYL